MNADSADLRALAEAMSDVEFPLEVGLWRWYEAANPARILALLADLDPARRSAASMHATGLDLMHERDALAAKVEAVRALHSPVRVQTGSKTHGGPAEFGRVCRMCDGFAYPCATIRALDGTP